MNAFSRSWSITKLTFNVIMKDKELIAYPILSGIFSLLFLVAMVFPTMLSSILENTEMYYQPMFYVIVFVMYLGLAFIATFFNVCVVYTAKKRFSGGDALFMESLKFAVSRIHLIFAWSLVAATVGLLLRVIERILARNVVGQVVMRIIISLLGMAWSIITLFVVPAMVYNGLGPIDALKSSVATLRKTWGESLIRYFGLGFAQFILLIAGLIVLIPLFIVSSIAGGIATVAVIIMAVAYVVLLAVVFSLANTVFNTALYEYAATGKVPTGYPPEVMRDAFRRQ